MSEGTIVVIVLATIMASALVCGIYFTWKDIHRMNKVATEARQRLAGTQLVVVVRTKDGKRTYQETIVIKQLMDLGAKVLDLSPEDGSKLWGGAREIVPEGAMAFVGTTWEESSVWYLDGRFLPKRTGEVKPNEPVLAPYFAWHAGPEKLHDSLAECVRHFL